MGWLHTVVLWLGIAVEVVFGLAFLGAILGGAAWLVSAPLAWLRARREPSFAEHYDRIAWGSWRKAEEQALAELAEEGRPVWTPRQDSEKSGEGGG